MKHKTPIGISEILPGNATLLAEKKQKLQKFFLGSGFLPIKTPTIEFSESLEPGMGPTLKRTAIEFFDPQGNRLMLRPDNTTPIARAVATRMKEKELPLKLSYIESVFRKTDIDTHSDSEVFQAGCEMIGYTSPQDIADIIEMCVDALKLCGYEDLGIDIGHVDFINDLDTDKRQALLAGDYVSYGKIPDRGKKECAQDHKDLELIFNSLVDSKLEDISFINKGLVSGLYYYTGTIFEIYSKKLNKVVASGGQYDQLCGQFGYDQPAVGFAINLNELLEDEHE